MFVATGVCVRGSSHSIDQEESPLPSLVSPPNDFWEPEAITSESLLSLSQLSVPLTLPQNYTRSHGLGMKFPLTCLGIERQLDMKTLLDSEINPLINS